MGRGISLNAQQWRVAGGIAGVLIIAVIASSVVILVACGLSQDDPEACGRPTGVSLHNRSDIRLKSAQAALGKAIRRRDALIDLRKKATSSARRKALSAKIRTSKAEVRKARAAKLKLEAEPPSVVASLQAVEGGGGFDLGRTLDSGRRSAAVTFDRPVTVGDSLLATSPGPFGREGDGRLVRADLVTWGWAVPDAKAGWVAFCIPPEERDQLAPGTYTGQIHLADSRLEPLVVPISFSISYPHPGRVILVGLALCALATVYTYSLRRRDIEKAANIAAMQNLALLWPPFTFWRGYFRWITELPGVLTVASGLAAASVAFAAQYLDSTGWGGSPRDWMTFAGAITTAFIAGSSTGKFVQEAYGPSTAAGGGGGAGAGGAGAGGAGAGGGGGPA
jgi:hypothetical protein